MWRKRTTWLAALVLGTSALLAPVAYSAEGPQTHSKHGRFQERLGLTDDQMTAIREIHGRHAEAGRQLWQGFRQARIDLRQLALNGGDEAAIKAKTEEVERLLAQAIELRVKTLQEIGPLLTPEQREKLAQMGDHGLWSTGAHPRSRS